ncbi:MULTISPECIES: hypothetical protein [unclassified Pseudomonas]|uniref:hypothetical protein n=1 Tax=unclassified Pseudomonas TaxID=196821 RepID=UPI0009DFD78D|nr:MULTISPECIES: hypothetical protein [unclassified Pseudomonas]
MKPATFKLDRHVFELLQDGDFQQFTIRSLRAGYARQLRVAITDVELWRYLYDQVQRLKRVGWVKQDPVRRKRDQVFHVLTSPANLTLSLVQHRFFTSFHETQSDEHAKTDRPSAHSEICPTQRLESLAKEIRLDMLSALGEAERYKQLFKEMPALRVRVEEDYVQARDRSSRLLGHLRAIENTLKMLVSTQ